MVLQIGVKLDDLQLERSQILKVRPGEIKCDKGHWFSKTFAKRVLRCDGCRKGIYESENVWQCEFQQLRYNDYTKNRSLPKCQEKNDLCEECYKTEKAAVERKSIREAEPEQRFSISLAQPSSVDDLDVELGIALSTTGERAVASAAHDEVPKVECDVVEEEIEPKTRTVVGSAAETRSQKQDVEEETLQIEHNQQSTDSSNPIDVTRLIEKELLEPEHEPDHEDMWLWMYGCGRVDEGRAHAQADHSSTPVESTTRSLEARSHCQEEGARKNFELAQAWTDCTRDADEHAEGKGEVFDSPSRSEEDVLRQRLEATIHRLQHTEIELAEQAAWRRMEEVACHEAREAHRKTEAKVNTVLAHQQAEAQQHKIYEFMAEEALHTESEMAQSCHEEAAFYVTEEHASREAKSKYRDEMQNWELASIRSALLEREQEAQARNAQSLSEESLLLVKELQIKLGQEIESEVSESLARRSTEEALVVSQRSAADLEDNVRLLTGEHSEFAAEAARQSATLEEESACLMEGQLQAQQEALRETERRKAEATMWRRAKDDLLRNEESVAMDKVKRAEKKRRRGSFRRLVLCGRGFPTSETEELCAELKNAVKLARHREQDASDEAAEEQLAKQRFDETRHRYRVHEAETEEATLEIASRRLEEEAAGREMMAAEEALQAETREEEAKAEARQARERVLNPTIALVTDVPMAVHIPRFSSSRQGLMGIGTMVKYTIVIESPGATKTLEKRFSEFKELYEELSAKPFANTLQALPQDWLFTSLSTTLVERRRRQLEAYLSILCTHSRVLLDPVIWAWLGIDDLTQHLVRLVTAHTVQWASEVSHVIESLEAMISSGADANRCANSAVVGVLREALLDTGDEATQAAACRLLTRLLIDSARVRQLFLASTGGENASSGVDALLQVCQSHSATASVAAADTTKAILKALFEESDDILTGETQDGSRGGRERRTSQSSVDEETTCCVCLDRDKSHALLPCGHLCTCMDCSDYLAARNSPCPVCRTQIERAVQIFV